MYMKKNIITSIFGGLILGVLSFLISVADITIRLSSDIILGPWEIINTISAALFGPIGLFITQLGMDIGGFVYLIRGTFSPLQDIYFMVGDYIAHTVSMLFVAFGYSFIYRRMKMPRLLLGWVLIMVIYYLVEITLAITLFKIVVPELPTSYAYAFYSVRLEFPLVTIITSLVLLALPENYRRPRWIEPKKAPDHDREITGV